MAHNVTRRRAAVIHERVSAAGGFLADVVRIVRADIPDLTQDEDRFLADAVRPDRRYGFTVIARIIDISARCQSPKGRYALAQAITEQVEARAAQGALPLVDAIQAEDLAQHTEDDAVRRYTLTRSPTDLARVREAVYAHGVALEQLHASAAAAADKGVVE